MRGVARKTAAIQAIADISNLLTTKDVAGLLRVHPKHVYRLMKRGLPALRVGDEWRFSREDVLQWAAAASHAAAQSPASGSDPRAGLVAANGDLVIEVLLAHLRKHDGVLFGFVMADHTQGTALLAQGRVLAAGGHAGIEGNAHERGGQRAKTVRIQLVTREVGLVTSKGRPVRQLRHLAGKRIATRPVTAGLRKRLDQALSRAGVDLGIAAKEAVEHACHRDVALAVARGEADVGLTTHAWAHAAGLGFLAIAEEDYELSFAADQMGDPRIVALCEAVQSGGFRRDLRRCAGYSVARTGRIRVD